MMKKNPLLISLCILAIMVGGQVTSQAQESGPIVDILGKPQTTPPNADAYVSVVDPTTGRIIDGLSDANFAVQVSEEDVEATASLDTTGVAVVMVIDRGGIAQSGRRIGWAVDLADNLLSLLNVDGSATTDMVGLIGIRGREDGGLTPIVPFTDWNPNDVSNQFDGLRTEIVREVTPLYDGIDKAIEWITKNPDAQIQDKLGHRRPIIVVFSDGIDNKFSSEAHETIIINKCLENGILLYAVRIGGGATDADNMQALATQTNGLYVTHNAETDDQALNLFQDIVTQRQSYHVTFPLYRPQGDYDVRIQVRDTPLGNGSDEARVSSRLQTPEIALTSPSDGLQVTVPYSRSLEGFLDTVVDLRVQITSVDGAEQSPQEVRYFANAEHIGTGTTPPDFPFTWHVSKEVTATEQVQSKNYTLVANADDTYLDEAMVSQQINIHVTWEKLPLPPLPERVGEEVRTNWWVILMLITLAMGLLVLLILLIRTRGELGRKVVSTTTGMLKGITKRLGATPQRAPGKLVVIQGANMGKEFRLATQRIVVGRDPQFCDFALYDDFASNPHFSIQLEQIQFFITDEGSTNGTRVNGMPIPKHQRMLLQPDAIIEVGQTRLQFKRLGGTTRQLGASQAPAAPSPAAAPHPPTQPAPGGQIPQQRGGPTRIVP